MQAEVDPEWQAEWEAWLSERPEIVKKTALAYPPNMCYRTSNRGHYIILAYDESGNIRVLHGADSFAPGFQVFGFHPQDLRPCDCGKWKEASVEEAQAMCEVADAVFFGGAKDAD